MTKQLWFFFNVTLILLGVALYYFLVIGNFGSATDVLLAELGSLAICCGWLALLLAMKDKK